MNAENTNPDSSVFADDPKNAAKLPCESLKEKALQENDDNPVHNFMKGLAYLSGINVEADHDLALRLITRAADTGLPMAYETLISMYQTGEGVERNYHTAIEWQKKYVALLRKQAMEQETAEVRRALLIALENLGDRQQAVGDIRSAKESYQQMLECALDMRQRGWGSRRYLSVSYERLEEICIAEGDLNSAKICYENALEIRRALAEESPTVESCRDLSISYSKIGNFCKAEGDLSSAKTWYENAMEISRVLVEESPTVESRRDLSISYERLGDICKAEGDLIGAKACHEKSLEFSQLLADETGTMESRRDLSISYERLGNICEAEDDLNGAKAWYEKALEIRRALADETGTVESLDDLAISYYKLGTLSLLPKTERRAYLEQFVEISKGLYQQTGLPSFQENIEEGQEELSKLND